MLGIIQGILGGGQGGALKTISKVIDDLHTSDEEKLDKKILMQRLQQKLAEKQLDVNAKEAGHRSIFVSGWRPFIGWVCGVSLAYHFILAPLVEWILVLSGNTLDLPEFDFSQLSTIVMGMLGLAGARSYEKMKGVSREQ